GCGRVEAGELEREDEVVRRARGEAVRVVADDDAGVVGLADPGEDDRSRVVGLRAAVAGAERLRLDAVAPLADSWGRVPLAAGPVNRVTGLLPLDHELGVAALVGDRGISAPGSGGTACRSRSVKGRLRAQHPGAGRGV